MTRTRASIRPPEASSIKDAVATLARPGPLEVLRGDLGIVGIPGILFAPAEGYGLPAVAFGHDWLQPADRYVGRVQNPPVPLDQPRDRGEPRGGQHLAVARGRAEPAVRRHQAISGHGQARPSGTVGGSAVAASITRR